METWPKKGRERRGGEKEEGDKEGKEVEGVGEGAEDGDFKSHNGFGTNCLRANTLLEYSFHLEAVTAASSFRFFRLTRRHQHS